MSDKNPQGEKPAVNIDQLTGRASFVFRGKKYDLPGTYGSLGEAVAAAEKRCRVMGWLG